MNGGVILILLCVGATILMYASIRSRAERDGEFKVVEFSIGWITGATGSVVLAITFCLVASGHSASLVTDWRVPTIMGVMVLPFMLEFGFRRVVFNENGATFHTPLAKPVTATWEEIVDVTFIKLGQYHRITLQDGRRIHLPDMLSGKEELLQTIASKLRCSHAD